MKRDKKLFYAALIITFIMALIYECLTPVLSDDFSYMKDVSTAGSLAGVFAQEVKQYLNWTGRSVSHIMVRLYMYFFGLDRSVFNVLAGLVFAGLMLLMYRLVKKEGSHDWRLLTLMVMLFWFFSVKPGQTVFWMTGAFNYLFTTSIILGFFALYRRELTAFEAGKGKPAGLIILGLVALIAGWCNENTSGGAVLFALIMLLLPALQKKWPAVFGGDQDDSVSKVPLYVRIVPLVCISLGYMMQLLSPGNRKRTALIEERHSGLMLYGARFLKIMEEINELFLPLLLIIVFLFILALRQGRKLRDPGMMNAVLFVFLFLATSGCLILAPDPQPRVYFGPGIFLMIAAVQLFERVKWEGAVPETVRDFVVIAPLIIFFFIYVKDGGNLARILREDNNRYAQMEAHMGDEEIGLPQLPEQFDCKYTMAYEVDLQIDWFEFPNMQLGDYYGYKVVSGIPYDTYDEVMAAEGVQ